jgi:PAS domain S-box-containing protein
MTDAQKVLERMIGDLKPGDHLCAIYQTPEQQQRILIPYIRQGLERREKVVYIIDHSTAESILVLLEQAGVPARQALASGQMEIFSRDEAYLAGGSFDPDRMIATLKQLEAKALEAGWSALRITGEMTWILSKLPGVERLIEYEATLNYFFPGSHSLGICQYWEEKFDPAILLDVVRAHPYVISGDLVCENTFYVPPDEMLATIHQPLSADTYHSFLHMIEERAQQLDCLRESEGRYRSLFEHMLDGFAFCRMIYEEGQPQDFIYLAVNGAFEKLTGLKDVVGKKVSEVIPGIRTANPELFDVYGRVASTGQPEQLEVYLGPLKMWLAISVYSPEKGTFVAVFENITKRKRVEAEIAHLASFPRLNPMQILEIDREENILFISPSISND